MKDNKKDFLKLFIILNFSFRDFKYKTIKR